MLHTRTSGQQGTKLRQNRYQELQISQWPKWHTANLSLYHPDSNRRYRNFTDSVLSGLSDGRQTAANTKSTAPSRSRGL